MAMNVTINGNVNIEMNIPSNYFSRVKPVYNLHPYDVKTATNLLIKFVEENPKGTSRKQVNNWIKVNCHKNDINGNIAHDLIRSYQYFRDSSNILIYILHFINYNVNFSNNTRSYYSKLVGCKSESFYYPFAAIATFYYRKMIPALLYGIKVIEKDQISIIETHIQNKDFQSLLEFFYNNKNINQSNYDLFCKVNAGLQTPSNTGTQNTVPPVNNTGTQTNVPSATIEDVIQKLEDASSIIDSLLIPQDSCLVNKSLVLSNKINHQLILMIK